MSVPPPGHGMTVGAVLPWLIIGAVVGIRLLLAAAPVIPAVTAPRPPRP
ncbi:hypothetical protein [Nonomuraea sp. NPDC050786]